VGITVPVVPVVAPPVVVVAPVVVPPPVLVEVIATPVLPVLIEPFELADEPDDEALLPPDVEVLVPVEVVEDVDVELALADVEPEVLPEDDPLAAVVPEELRTGQRKGSSVPDTQ
jgi:hypothetical protein